MGAMLKKTIVSIIECSLAWAVIFIVFKTIFGTPVTQSIRLVMDSWWLCLGLGVFVTVVRMMEKNFFTESIHRGGSYDPGLASHGSCPNIENRQMSKAEWKAKHREKRKQKRAQKSKSGDSTKVADSPMG